ncbi:nitrogenase associated protein E [Desulfosarcina ovata subsp. sediminis]|uniref:Nitrogenase associated protein E n=1 Tax=Desulfosarcina ovata subsp. sediminis TaxID=885957 RepID=A0A5K7ZQJ6_9BACT|nr:nitrogenase component 1 [Desulfosarcina ovata]BBO81960.1 nitrogenase associated protein E [Desulfosarcina ovata subsp. sediminis]
MNSYEDASVEFMSTRLWMMHRFCIHCKLSGGVFAATEIQGAIPIIHGPIGCAFNHRLPVMKSFLDMKALPCTDMDENDTVFGGMDKLRKTIDDVDEKYHPDLIIVLLTCLSGIIGDDVEGVIEDVKEAGKVKADIVWADTSGFKFRELRTERTLKEWLHNYKNPEDYTPRNMEGCGQVEVINSLATQLMEPAEKYGGIIENGVNIVGMGTRRWGIDRTKERMEILREAGAEINTIFFRDVDCEKVKRSSCARVNIGFRVGRWMHIMKDRFGIDTVYNQFRFSHLSHQEKIRSFYMETGEKLGIEERMKRVMDDKMDLTSRQLQPYRDFLRGKRVVILGGGNVYGFFGLDSSLSIMMDLGLKIEAVSLDQGPLVRRGISEELRRQHRETILDLFGKLGVDPDIIDVEPFGILKEIMEKYKPDLVVCAKERKPQIHALGVPAYSPQFFTFFTGFSGLQNIAQEICLEMKKENLTRKKPLIFNEIDYHPVYFPYIRKVGIPIQISEELQCAVKKGGKRCQ